MTFYEVNYRQEDAPNGIARLYFTSKRAAHQAAREIQQDYLEAKRAWDAAWDAGVGHYDMPAAPGEAPEPVIVDLRFSGTRREQMLQALRHARL